MTYRQKLRTVGVFFIINLKRLFRDRLALFFTFLFPLIFLFVFGGLNSGGNDLKFNVAIITESQTAAANDFVEQIKKAEVFEVSSDVTTFEQANEKMSRSELDATIELPAAFGEVKEGQTIPSGEITVHYTQNNESAARTLTTVLESQLQTINAQLVDTQTPFTVKAEQNNERSLSAFDYTFTGLLGFAILGAGIFGPINVFPELKKQGILRRLHTTPLRVWQYFLSVMFGNAASGLMSIGLMFLVAIAVYNLQVVGSIFDLTIFLTLGLIMILGIGLAVGGWAKNERQAAPLANIIVFPMMFLSGTFFPRFLMPEWLQTITTYLPLTPVIDGARLIATEGQSLLGVLPQLGVITGWLIVIYFLAFRVFRWE